MTNPEDIEKPLLGYKWGWNGEEAAILTAYGIQKGETGRYVIKSKEYLPENKKFFYNTINYWNSWYYGETENYHWIDNFHTGYNLDSLKCYIDSTNDKTFEKHLFQG